MEKICYIRPACTNNSSHTGGNDTMTSHQPQNYDTSINTITESSVPELTALLMHVNTVAQRAGSWTDWQNLITNGYKVITCTGHHRIVGVITIKPSSACATVLYMVIKEDEPYKTIKAKLHRTALKEQLQVGSGMLYTPAVYFKTLNDSENIADIKTRLSHMGYAPLANDLEEMIVRLEKGDIINRKGVHHIIQKIEGLLIQYEIHTDRIAQMRRYIYGLVGTNVTLATVSN